MLESLRLDSFNNPLGTSLQQGLLSLKSLFLPNFYQELGTTLQGLTSLRLVCLKSKRITDTLLREYIYLEI
jgi:hypothetical protein